MNLATALNNYRCERCFKPVTARVISLRSGKTLCFDCSDRETLELERLQAHGPLAGGLLAEGLVPGGIARLLRQ